MAITFDATTQLLIDDGSTSNSVSHTCTGSNLILWCMVENNNILGVTSMTYGGVALTKAIEQNEANGQQLSLWYLIGPATGANTFAVTRVNGAGNSWWQIASYTGAKQTAQPDATTATVGTTETTLTATLTTTADNCWAVMVGYANGANDPSPSAGTGTSKRAVMATDRSAFFEPTAVKTPAGSYSTQITAGSAGTVITVVMASFAPFVAGGGSSHNLTLMDVGT